MMLIHKIGFLITKDKRSNAREEDWGSIHCVYMETCCWITTMRAGHTSVEDSIESILVSCESDKNGWQIARDTPDHPDMFCSITEVDGFIIYHNWDSFLGIVYLKVHTLCLINLEFCFFRAKTDMVLGAEDPCQMKKIHK